MGTVVANIRVSPESPEVNLAELKQLITKAIPPGVTLKNISEKPIAFGLKALNVQITMPDGMGGTDRVEEALAKLPHIQSVETTDVGLL
ncbi:MAG: elongation factor 1-beta [Halobacteriales archaeon]|nr:elongation factor 1-beta [Halobacteriales archaeon]